MTYDFVAVGDVTNDTFIKLSDAHVEKHGGETNLCMRFGDKIPYAEQEFVAGVGNAGNAAIAARRLGLNAALVTDIGTDRGGDECLAAWEKDRLDTSLVRRHAEWPTHHHYVLRFGAERTILIKHQPWPYQLPTFPETPSWLYFTSTGEHGEAYHHDIAAYVKESGTKLAFQPGTFQIELSVEGKVDDLYAVTEFFVCNKEEAQRILKIDEQSIPELMKRMRDKGPTIVAITDGPRGAFAMGNEGAWVVPMYPDPAPPISRTGAGDAFASTVVSMLSIGMSVPDALIRGPINSMAVVQKVGAQTGLLTRDELEKLLAGAPPEYALETLA